MERIVTQEDITHAVHRFGLENDSVVTGQGSLVALGVEGRGMFGSLELTVDQEAYRALRETDGWQDTIEDLRREGVVVSSGSPETVARRGFAMSGVRYEGLPDIYGLAQATGDRETEDLIRGYLLSADVQLPMEATVGEIGRLNSKLPERLQGSPELVVAAQGLYAVRTLYGSLADANSAHAYRGSYETEVVASLYHNHEHTWHDVTNGVIRQAARAGMTDDQLSASVAAAAVHDMVMGHGRQADNPESYDELRSAELAREWLLQAGADESQAQAAYEGVLATAFNEATGGQNVRQEAGFVAVQTAVAGADLSRAAMPYNVQNGFLWPLEDLQRRNSNGLLQFARSKAQRDVGVTSPEVMLAIIDEDAELRQAFGVAVGGNGAFFESLHYPEGWLLDDPGQRQKGAAILRASGARITAGASVLAEYRHMRRLAPAPWDEPERA